MASSVGYNKPQSKSYGVKGKVADSYNSSKSFSQGYGRLFSRQGYSAPLENVQRYSNQVAYRDKVSRSAERLPGDLERALAPYFVAKTEDDGGRIVCFRCMGELGSGGVCRKCGR